MEIFEGVTKEEKETIRQIKINALRRTIWDLHQKIEGLMQDDDK
jgi:hypothetical protein